jgi:hypothetical protein
MSGFYVVCEKEVLEVSNLKVPVFLNELFFLGSYIRLHFPQHKVNTVVSLDFPGVSCILYEGKFAK